MATKKKSKLSEEFEQIKKENPPQNKFCDAKLVEIHTTGVDWSKYTCIDDFASATMSIGPAMENKLGRQVGEIWNTNVLVNGNLIYQMLRLMAAAEGKYIAISKSQKCEMEELRNRLGKIIENLE